MLDESYVDTFISRHDTLSKNVEDYKKMCQKYIINHKSIISESP